MRAQIAEIVGVALIVAAMCGLVGAASMVSTALAVAVASGFLLLAGVLTVYVAAAYDRAEKAKLAQGERRQT